jgi:hypothetical protein
MALSAAVEVRLTVRLDPVDRFVLPTPADPLNTYTAMVQWMREPWLSVAVNVPDDAAVATAVRA